MTQQLGLGVIGLGGFGMFALQQFVQVPQVQLRMIAGTTRQESHRAAERYGAAIGSVEEMLARDDIDLVYINTPPFLHAIQTRQCLAAGKHVLVEKPLATSLSDGIELLAEADRRGLMLTTNLMQRFNPLVMKLKDLFDLARHWFGESQPLTAGSSSRSDGCIDQVWCDRSYDCGLIGRFYHGFNQAARTESQTWQIVLERGRIEMEGWIPLACTIIAATDESTTRQLMEIFPTGTLDVLDNYGSTTRQAIGHGIAHEAYQKIQLTWNVGLEKQALYCQLLCRMMVDQSTWLHDPSVQRVVTELDGLESLRCADQCKAAR